MAVPDIGENKMKRIIWMYFVVLAVLFMLPVSANATCGQSCIGTCVNCLNTIYPYCDYPNDTKVCPQQVVDKCCFNGYCTVCDDKGSCYVNGCPINSPGPGNPGDPPTPTPVPPTATPAVPGTMEAVAVQVNPSDTSCTAIHNSVTGIDQTTFGFTVNPPAPKIQSGLTPVIFPNVTPGWYTLTASPPDPKWVATYPCIYRNGVFTGTIGYTAVVNGGETVRWEIGYTNGTSWAQTAGGDVYASASLRSFIPPVSPRVFNDNGDGGYPGVVTYGAFYDFDSDVLSFGNLLVSPVKNWLVNATRATVDYYDFFYHRFGSPTATDNALFANIAGVQQSELSAGKTTYYISGDMGTTGDWSFDTGHSAVFLVDGNISF